MKYNKIFNKTYDRIYHPFFVFGIALLIIMISGCSGPYNGGSQYANTRYYTGYDSLTMNFVSDSPPYTFYYDPTSNNNEIPIVVEVKNKGASDAVGTIFVHGYDPHIMEVAGGPTQWPTGANIGLSGSSGTSFSFGVSGRYAGVATSGRGTNVGAAFTTRTGGYQYGAGVYSGAGGQSFSFSVNSARVGSRVAYPVMQSFMSYGSAYSFNALIGLEGDSSTTPGGGTEVYEFPTYIYYLPPSLEQFRQPIMVTACYSYATHASTMVCVDPHPNSNTKKVCRPQTVSMGSGQGAPVAITSIEQQASSQKTVFTIHVRHNRQNSLDEVYDYYSLDKCAPDSGQIVKSTDKNVVYINYIALSATDITANCVPSNGRIRLDESGSGEISCSVQFDQTLGNSGAYEAPLEIELGYGYSKNIYKEILIKRI